MESSPLPLTSMPLRSSAGISCPPPHGRNGRTESATENEIRPRKNGRMCKDTYGCGEKKRYYAGQPSVNEVSQTFGCLSLDSHASAVAARAGQGSARTAGSRPHRVTVRHAVGAAPLQSCESWNCAVAGMSSVWCSSLPCGAASADGGGCGAAVLCRMRSWCRS